ncbi:MAG: ABC transporter substrate-binding protein [Anaerolineae bacterium]|nr:ABC transporter substrate-binding protein [Anaerolineae bacterium]
MFSHPSRRLLASLLFIVVLVGIQVPAALISSAQDLPTLDYYFVAFAYKPDDLTEVENAANAILEKEIGARVRFHTMTFTDAPTRGALILNAGDPCDVMSFSQFNPFNRAVTTGGLMAIGDMLAEHAPTVLGNFSPEEWNAVKSGGQVYGAPVFVGGISRAAFWVRGDLTEKYDFDWQSATTLEAWEPFFDTVLEQEEGVIPLVSSEPYWGRQWFPNYYGYDPISEDIGAPAARGMVGVKLDDADTQVVAVAFTPEYRQAAELARRWYEKGYFLQTPPIDSEMIALRAQLRFAAFQVPFGGNWSTKAMAANEWNGVPIYTAFYQPQTVVTTGKILSSVYGVCAVSQHPVEAVKFIEEMNTNADLLNLFNYGIEGKHWVWVDEANKIVGYPEGVDGNTVGWNPNTYWQFGDKRLVYITTPDDIGVLDRDAADLANAIVSPIMGFVPDLSPIQNELAQLATAAKQYCEPVDKGMVEVDSGLQACQDAIKAAGIDTIVAELQSQIDAWKASNAQ